MRVILALVLLAIVCTGCLTRKERNLMSPCTALDSYGLHLNDGSNTNPCVRRPVNVWLS